MRSIPVQFTSITALVLLLFTVACTAPTPPTDQAEKPSQQKVNLPKALDLSSANALANLPLACIHQEYPNKLGQVLGADADLGSPQALHPAFYGCFDWHSSVHGHWSLVTLLKQFPELDRAQEARAALGQSLTMENIAAEIHYFQGEHNTSYERTYGWAWLLKLAEELHTWDDPDARKWEAALQPLSELISQRYQDFLPKLAYPIRVGEHTNTAFGLTFALDYSRCVSDTALERVIVQRALEMYTTDSACPLSWEPSGYDFLSPCLEEVDVMRRVMPVADFHNWMSYFLPSLADPKFKLETGVVSDRTDGKLVHLDGLNFSRAWVLYGLAAEFPTEYGHLVPLANAHVDASLGQLTDDSYEGGHWLGSFAICALTASEVTQP